MAGWSVERIVHFGPGEFLKDGLAHFGFHLPDGRYCAISHQKHQVAMMDPDGRVAWTLAPEPVFEGVPNIPADLEFPMYADLLPDGGLVVSNFGNARLYRVDPEGTRADLLVDGRKHGLVDMGNCVVDAKGSIWVNEVRGCRVWRFDPEGTPTEILGHGVPGFQAEPTSFEAVRFSWAYDLRRGPHDTLYVLDSRNFALRVIDIVARTVRLLAGTGRPGEGGDGGPAHDATFGGDPSARFDGPISLSVDEAGNAYVGDRFNHVVRMVDAETGLISTIAGRREADPTAANDGAERDPLRLNLPMISSMDHHRGRLFVPTDLEQGQGDLAVLRRG